MTDTETWLQSSSSVLLLCGCFANLFSLAAVKNSANSDIDHLGIGSPKQAYARHTNYLQHASDAFLNFLTVPLIHLQNPLLASHIQAIPIAVVVWMHVLRSISRTARLARPFLWSRLMSDYKNSMVGMAYLSSLLVFLYTTVFNFSIFFDIVHNFRDTISWMMAAQGWILPGVILLVANVALLVTIWLNGRENKRDGLVVNYGYQLRIAAYGLLTTLIFISTTTASMLAHPLHKEVLLQKNLTATGNQDTLTPLHSILLPTLLSLLNPPLCLIFPKFRRRCKELMIILQGNLASCFN